MKIVKGLAPTTQKRRLCFKDVPEGGVFEYETNYAAVKQPSGKACGLANNVDDGLNTEARTAQPNPDDPVIYYPDACVVLGRAVTEVEG